MKHDYKAAIDELKTYQHLMHESGLPILNKMCFDVIEHALLMMQKLQEPSEGMEAVVEDALDEAYDKGKDMTVGRAACYVVKAMLEQAEKEIG